MEALQAPAEAPEALQAVGALQAPRGTDGAQAVAAEAAAEIPDVFLRGLPGGLLIDGTPERRAGQIDEDLKLFMGDRHEHFRPLAETVTIGGRELRAFEWTRSTVVAR